MKCKHCSQKAVTQDGLCKDHFIKYFEKTVDDTVKSFSLLKGAKKVLVATSGGKDSLSVLYNVKRLHKNVEALIVDEGILGYREHTLEDLKRFCKDHKVKLNIVSFKKEFGKTLDAVIKKNKDVNPCTFCGILRRFMINKYSQKYDVVVLGHNLDDEVQSIMMNIFRGNLEISSRLGPKTGSINTNKFTPRIKPLYFLKEKEVKIYSTLKGFQDKFIECPYSQSSYRNFVRDYLNKKESEFPGIKKNIITNFLDILPELKKKYKSKDKIKLCKSCGYPGKTDTCNTCATLIKYGLLKK
jgi:uncharacterized protein (TIGR00269 family)